MRVLVIVMGAAALLHLAEADKLPFGARIGVRRVRSRATSKPFQINWAKLNINNDKKFSRKEKQIQKFPYLPPPADLDYGEDGEASDVPAPDDSFEPLFDTPDIESEDEPPVINPDVPGVIISPVSPSPSPDTSDIPTPDPVSDVPQIVSNNPVPFVPQPVSSGPVSLVPGPWQTVSDFDSAPLQPGPWVPVSNLPPQDYIPTTVFIDNSINPFKDIPFQDPVVDDFYNPAVIDNVDPILINNDPAPLQPGPWVPVSNPPESPIVEAPQVVTPQCVTVTETIVEEEREESCRIVNESSCFKTTLDNPTKVRLRQNHSSLYVIILIELIIPLFSVFL